MRSAASNQHHFFFFPRPVWKEARSNLKAGSSQKTETVSTAQVETGRRRRGGGELHRIIQIVICYFQFPISQIFASIRRCKTVARKALQHFQVEKKEANACTKKNQVYNLWNSTSCRYSTTILYSSTYHKTEQKKSLWPWSKFPQHQKDDVDDNSRKTPARAMCSKSPSSVLPLGHKKSFPLPAMSALSLSLSVLLDPLLKKKWLRSTGQIKWRYHGFG